MSLNKIVKKLRTTIIFGNISNKPRPNSFRLIVFGNGFHHSKFKGRSLGALVSLSFGLLFINYSKSLLFKFVFLLHNLKEKSIK